MAFFRRDFIKKIVAFWALFNFIPFMRSARNQPQAAEPLPAPGTPDSLAPAPAPEPAPAPPPAAAPAPTVAVEPCADYDLEAVYQAVKSALAKINFTLPAGKTILLKPNLMAQNTPDQAASTHPAVVDAVCRIFTETGNTVTIGDCMAYYQGGGTRQAMKTTGMEAVAKKYGARLLPFEATLLKKITTGRILNPLYLTEAVFTHDLVVNLPKLKLHRLARYSGAVKNTFGCVVGATKQIYHHSYEARPDYKEFWGGPIVDVHQAVHPGLTVMDAIVGLDKDGPAASPVYRRAPGRNIAQSVPPGQSMPRRISVRR